MAAVSRPVFARFYDRLSVLMAGNRNRCKSCTGPSRPAMRHIRGRALNPAIGAGR